MDVFIALFLIGGFLFFWAIWIFGYWLPMAKEAQREFKRQEAREQAARQRPLPTRQAPAANGPR